MTFSGKFKFMRMTDKPEMSSTGNSNHIPTILSVDVPKVDKKKNREENVEFRRTRPAEQVPDVDEISSNSASPPQSTSNQALRAAFSSSVRFRYSKSNAGNKGKGKKSVMKIGDERIKVGGGEVNDKKQMNTGTEVTQRRNSVISDQFEDVMNLVKHVIDNPYSPCQPTLDSQSNQDSRKDQATGSTKEYKTPKRKPTPRRIVTPVQSKTPINYDSNGWYDSPPMLPSTEELIGKISLIYPGSNSQRYKRKALDSLDTLNSPKNIAPMHKTPDQNSERRPRKRKISDIEPVSMLKYITALEQEDVNSNCSLKPKDVKYGSHRSFSNAQSSPDERCGEDILSPANVQTKRKSNLENILPLHALKAEKYYYDDQHSFHNLCDHQGKNEEHINSSPSHLEDKEEDPKAKIKVDMVKATKQNVLISTAACISIRKGKKENVEDSVGTPKQKQKAFVFWEIKKDVSEAERKTIQQIVFDCKLRPESESSSDEEDSEEEITGKNKERDNTSNVEKEADDIFETAEVSTKTNNVSPVSQSSSRTEDKLSPEFICSQIKENSDLPPKSIISQEPTNPDNSGVLINLKESDPLGLMEKPDSFTSNRSFQQQSSRLIQNSKEKYRSSNSVSKSQKNIDFISLNGQKSLETQSSAVTTASPSLGSLENTEASLIKTKDSQEIMEKARSTEEKGMEKFREEINHQKELTRQDLHTKEENIRFQGDTTTKSSPTPVISKPGSKIVSLKAIKSSLSDQTLPKPEMKTNIIRLRGANQSPLYPEKQDCPINDDPGLKRQLFTSKQSCPGKYRKIVFTTSEEESEEEFVGEKRKVTFKNDEEYEDEEYEDEEEEIMNMVNTEEEKTISDRNDSVAPSLSHRNMFGCQVCSKLFCLYEDCLLHLDLEHSERSRSKLILPTNIEKAKMFTCCTESCVDMFRTASLNLLKAHIHIRHPGAKKTRFLCFCQICKGKAFKDNETLRDHLVQVHGFEKDSENTLTHFFCIPCKKQIGNRVAWEAHRNKYYHIYRFGVYTMNKENKNQGMHDVEEGIGLDVEDYTVCSSIQEADQASKNFAGPGSKSKQNLIHCVNCPDIFHRNRIDEHVYKCHPNSTFQCEYIVKRGWNEEHEGGSKRRCGKMLVTAPNMIKHLQYHDRSINRIHDACIKRLVTLPEDLRWFRCQICSFCVNAQNIAVISDHVKSTHSGGVQGHGEGKIQVDDEGDGILPWKTQPLLVVDFGCRICGVVAQGPQGYDKLMVHIEQCRNNHRISVFQRIAL